MMDTPLLPRARLRDLLAGRAALVGTRLDPSRTAGLVSPIEARLHVGIPYGDLRAEEARLLAERSPSDDALVAARAALAALLGKACLGRDERRPRIVSTRVDNVSIAEAVAAILEPPATPRTRARFVHFVHAHGLTLGARDPAHAERLARADLVLPDGIGLRLGAALLGVSLRHNVNGTDLLPLLCAEAARGDVPLALVGAAPGIADECARRLRAATPDLRIPLVSDGYLSDDAAMAYAAALRALGRVVVLVGMGSPRQEAWAWRHLVTAREATVVTVGGLFDFYSGRIRRAPIAWRELGLEWVWRILQEPRRLARRYLVGNPLFVALVIRQRLASRA